MAEPKCLLGPLHLLPILSVSIMVISFLTQDSEVILGCACLATLFIWLVINGVAFVVRSRINHQRNNHSPEAIREYRATPTTTPQAQRSSRERVAPFVAENILAQMDGVMARRGQYSQDTRLVHDYGRRAQIATMAMRALPPVQSFIEDETTTTGSQHVECPICMEVFNNGELIQPFGSCGHEFHSSCLNSWLHSGKTSCPLCRKDITDLATSIMLSGGT